MRKIVTQTSVMGLALFNAPALFSRLYQYDWYGQILRDWVHGLDLPTDARILEIGSGPGDLTHELFAMGFDVVGVDKGVKMVAKAQKRFPSIQFRQADAFVLPFEDQTFDAVIAASVLNVVDDKSGLIQEMARVTKQGGTVSAFFPTPDFTTDRTRDFSTRNALSGFEAAAIAVWSGVSKKLESKTMVQVFENAGLEEITATPFFDGMLASVTGKIMASANSSNTN